MIGKIATALLGARIAADSRKSGVMGTVVGIAAGSMIRRSPAGALAVGGLYVAQKLWKKKQEIDRKGPHQAAIDDGLIPPDPGTVKALPAKD